MIGTSHHWPEVPLGECCTVVSGATPKRDRPEYWEGDILWVTPKDISNLDGAVLEDTPECISRAGFDSCSATILPRGSILFSSRAPIGLVAIAGREMCTNQGFKSLVPGECVHSGYLYYVMKRYAPRVADLGKGATFKEVSKEIVSSFKIPLPPLKEQRRIAAILGKADTIRRKQEQTQILADDFLRSAFLDMFGDPAFNPKGHEVDLVENVLSQSRTGIQSGPFGSALKKHEYVSTGIPVWGIDNVQPNRFVPSAKLFITEMKFDQLARYAVQDGDVLISRAGTVGRMCIARPEEERSIIGTNLVRVCLDAKRLLPEYFVNLMTYFPHRLGGLRTNQKENAFTFLNPKTLRAFKIPIPPIDTQLRFSEMLEKRENLIFHTEQEIARSSRFFGSLSQRAFRGEL